ncbi:MAG: DNA polymerase I [Elusimicrobia bacterium]|nr:DNA polymerase I [Elusimicrobiota bacterium]
MTQSPRFYLVDAHAYLHRAYHALPPLTNSKGEPVGALYGFARMLLQLIKRDRPERLAVCFDTPEPTFRHKAYVQYKATRREIDGDLLSQLKSAREMVSAMGLACVECPGYEADDVMATLACRGAKEGLECVLVTGDKDALQMVRPGIRVFNASKGIWMDSAEIEAKLGVGPEAVVDYLALVGDSSDNIPGVRGVGPVGAVKLLKKFGPVESLLDAAKSRHPGMAPKLAQALSAGEKSLREALSLLRLREDAPVALELDACGVPSAPNNKFLEVFGRLEFHTLIKELAGSSAPASSSAEKLCHDVPWEKIEPLLANANEFSVLVQKEDGHDYLAFGLSEGSLAVLEAGQAAACRERLLRVLKGKAIKATYDLKETMECLGSLGIEMAPPYFDAKLAAYCLSPARVPDPKAADGGRLGWRDLLRLRAGRAGRRLELLRRMDEAGVLKLYEGMELPLVRVLLEMEREGVAVDGPYLRRLSGEFDSEISSRKDELDQLAGFSFNVNSPKQLGELLFDKLGLPVAGKTAGGGRSTNEEALRILSAAHPIPAKVLEYRELSKLKSTYIDGLLSRLDSGTGRVHTHFDQTGTETGRLSSLNPNLQNIPIRSLLGQKIRRAFIAKPGHCLVSADYSQIDLRVLAHVSQDQVLLAAFERGEDIHLRTACEIFRASPSDVDPEMRRRAKAVNFGIVYGQTAFGLAGELGIPQFEAASIIKKYFERYQGVAEWMEKNLARAREEGLVRTFLGRLRLLPDIAAKNTVLRQFSERAARNTPIQGGSADIIKLAMLKVHEGLGARAKMLLQIHDELLFEVPLGQEREFAAWAAKAMEGAVSLSVPLVVCAKAGPNWQDMEPLK